MEVSIGIIANSGIQHLTIKNIARFMGISEPAIYRHFSSKHEILSRILGSFEDIARKELPRISGMELSACEKLRFLFRNHAEVFSLNPALAAVIFSEEIFQNEEELSRRVAAVMDFSQKAIAKIITQGQDRGEIRREISATRLALITMGTLRLLVTRWRMSGNSFSLVREAAEMWHSLSLLFNCRKEAMSRVSGTEQK